MAPKPTLEAITLLGEFGFEFVAADQVGEPTPGRIADRLSEIITVLEEANARGNPSAVRQATEKLKRLQQAIDVWSLLASELDDQPAPQPPPPSFVQAPVPVQPAPAPSAPPPPPVPSAPPVAVQPPPAPAPAAPVSDYPPPPVVNDGVVDVEQLEKAAAGTQQAFWQTVGQVPGGQDKKK